MGIAFALLAAAGYGASYFFTQLGLRARRVPALNAMMVNLVSANLALWLVFLFSLFFQPVVFRWNGLAFFVGAGLSAPLFGRYANLMSIQRIGAARASALVLSENIFAGPLAFLLFGQVLSLMTITGVVILVGGMALFIYEVDAGTGASLGTLERPGGAGLSYARVGIAYGVASGLFAAAANLLRQAGVDAIPSALLGSAIGTLAALVVVGASALRSKRLVMSMQMDRRDATHFAASGIASSIAMLALFWALDTGSTVAVATAIKNTSPLFTFALVAAFLPRHERVTLRLGLLIALVVAGAALIAAGRLH